MDVLKITNGVYWIEVPSADLRVLCGCPADIIKHLMVRGLVVQRTKDGQTYESGPNAILLSDVSIQNGQFSNLAEFPILQMLYRQGMIIPGHPNNTGFKPLLIGLPNQIQAQSEYIARGNYGLNSVEEIVAAGASHELAEEIYRIKKIFAFNEIKKSEELIDFKAVENDAVELRNGVTIHRKKMNCYEFQHEGQTVTVDLNLKQGEEYAPAFALDYHKVEREYFSVIHIGEGDGWDVRRPCMSSLVIFQGKIYLIDTGPNIMNSLTALGISVNEIEGIFHTHAHDDHFAGLTSLVRSDHRIRYYATPLVRASVTKKLKSLMTISEQRFKNSFIIQDLEFDQWNNISGLEVMPVFSPHPVETSVMFFRTFWEGGYKTYAHLADIPSNKVLEGIFPKEQLDNPVSRKINDNYRSKVFQQVDLKKIDIGGGMIHGSAEDFAFDKSSKIVLSHIARGLTVQEKEIGSNATFGQADVLIHSSQDYSMQSAYRYLHEYFPKAPSPDLHMLLNCPLRTFNAGEIIIRKGEHNRHISLILSGVVEYVDAKKDISKQLSAGSFLGELSALYQEPSRRTYRASSYVKALQFSEDIYLEFIRRNYNREEIQKIYDTIGFLQSTYLFGEMVSSIHHNWLALGIEVRKVAPGDKLFLEDEVFLAILKSGEADVYYDTSLVDTLAAGDFFGEESVLLGSSNIFKAVAVKPVELMLIPGASLKGIPIIEWKIMEAFEKRLKAVGQLGV